MRLHHLQAWASSSPCLQTILPLPCPLDLEAIRDYERNVLRPGFHGVIDDFLHRHAFKVAYRVVADIGIALPAMVALALAVRVQHHYLMTVGASLRVGLEQRAARVPVID